MTQQTSRQTKVMMNLIDLVRPTYPDVARTALVLLYTIVTVVDGITLPIPRTEKKVKIDTRKYG